MEVAKEEVGTPRVNEVLAGVIALISYFPCRFSLLSHGRTFKVGTEGRMPKAGGAADEGVRAAMQRRVPHAYRLVNTSRKEVVTRTDQAFD